MDFSHLLLSRLESLGLGGHSFTCRPVDHDLPDRRHFRERQGKLENAILDRGMVVGRTLHVREMLDRSGPDLGFPRSVYLQAVSLEFCSASISHRMIAVDPVNIVICPFTIAVYVKADAPGKVFVAFRRPQPVGDDGSIAFDIFSLLDGIAREAIE